LTKPFAQNKSHTVNLSSCDALEMTTLSTNTCLKSFTPLVNSHVHNVLVEIAPEMNQLMFQFINAVVVCMVVHI